MKKTTLFLSIILLCTLSLSSQCSHTAKEAPAVKVAEDAPDKIPSQTPPNLADESKRIAPIAKEMMKDKSYREAYEALMIPILDAGDTDLAKAMLEDEKRNNNEQVYDMNLSEQEQKIYEAMKIAMKIANGIDEESIKDERSSNVPFLLAMGPKGYRYVVERWEYLDKPCSQIENLEEIIQYPPHRNKYPSLVLRNYLFPKFDYYFDTVNLKNKTEMEIFTCLVRVLPGSEKFLALLDRALAMDAFKLDFYIPPGFVPDLSKNRLWQLLEDEDLHSSYKEPLIRIFASLDRAETIRRLISIYEKAPTDHYRLRYLDFFIGEEEVALFFAKVLEKNPENRDLYRYTDLLNHPKTIRQWLKYASQSEDCKSDAFKGIIQLATLHPLEGSKAEAIELFNLMNRCEELVHDDYNSEKGAALTAFLKANPKIIPELLRQLYTHPPSSSSLSSADFYYVLLLCLREHPMDIPADTYVSQRIEAYLDGDDDLTYYNLTSAWGEWLIEMALITKPHSLAKITEFARNGDDRAQEVLIRRNDAKTIALLKNEMPKLFKKDTLGRAIQTVKLLSHRPDSKQDVLNEITKVIRKGDLGVGLDLALVADVDGEVQFIRDMYQAYNKAVKQDFLYSRHDDFQEKFLAHADLLQDLAENALKEENKDINYLAYFIYMIPRMTKDLDESLRLIQKYKQPHWIRVWYSCYARLREPYAFPFF